MAYGNRTCRNFFTVGQGERARKFIVATNQKFIEIGSFTVPNPNYFNNLAPNNITVSKNTTFTSGRRFLIARSSATINTTSFIVSSTARMNINGQSVVLKPGVRLSPSANGYTIIRTNTLCL